MTKLRAEMGDVDQLAQIIRKVDGAHTLGAGALAEAVIGELKRLRAARPMSDPNDKQKCGTCGHSRDAHNVRRQDVSEFVCNEFDDGNTTASPGSSDSKRVGDLYQITEAHGRSGWIGAIVMATEIKPWGIQGFVHMVNTHDDFGRAYIRLKWEEIEHVGHAHLIPADEASHV